MVEVVATAAEAVAGTTDGTSLAGGGLGLAGIPWTLVDGGMVRRHTPGGGVALASPP